MSSIIVQWMTGHSRVNVRRTHPALYRTIMVFATMKIALAVNFWYSNPTFNPYGWDKNLVGLVFFLLGTSQLVFLNLVRRLRMVRRVLAASISWLLFWGLTNSQQFFAGNASLQLPILYVAMAVVQIPLLIEPAVNPMTEKQ